MFEKDDCIYAVFCSGLAADAIYAQIKNDFLVSVVLIYKKEEETELQDYYRKFSDVEIYINSDFEMDKHTMLSGLNRCFLFLIKRLSSFKKLLLYYAQNHLQSIIPEYYQYSFTMRSSCNAYRNFPVYRKNVLQGNDKRIAVILVNKGYGDAVLLYPLIQKFAREKADAGYRIDIYHSYHHSMDLANHFVHDHAQYMYPYIDTRITWSVMDETVFDVYESIYDFAKLTINSAFTYIREASKFLGTSCADDFLNTMTVRVDPTEEELRQYQSRYKYVVGIQFYTHDDMIDDIPRSWNASNSLSFIQHCLENNIGIVNLTPCPFPLPDWIYRADDHSVSELFSVIKALDACVTIDSCCGHVAAVLGVPNVVLLGTILPGQSQQTLRMNQTLISRTGRVNDIRTTTVMDYVLPILKNNHVLTNELKPVYDFKTDSVWVS